MKNIKIKDIKSFASEVWEGGYAGSASVQAKFIQVIPSEKVAEIKNAFRPLVEAKLAEYAKLPKSVLNKSFLSDELSVQIKLHDSDSYLTPFVMRTFQNFWTSHFVRGREIKTLRSADDILENVSICCWDTSRSYDRITLYKAICKDENGSDTFHTFQMFSQPRVEITRKNWGRAKSRKQFEDLVCSKIKENEENGWELISASYVGDCIQKPMIVFKKAV